MKKILLISTLVFLFVKCDMNNQKLALKNNSSKIIYYRLLTDTILDTGIQIYEAKPHETVMPNFVMGRGEGVWEYKINHQSPDSTLHIFIFMQKEIDADVIIEKKYKRFDYKVKDLNSLNWTVTINQKDIDQLKDSLK